MSRHRIDEADKTVGLRSIAEIRAQLAVTRPQRPSKRPPAPPRPDMTDPTPPATVSELSERLKA